MRRSHSIGGAVFLAAAIALQVASSGAAAVPAAPLVVLWEHESAASLDGISPTVAIYQDGTVIARRDSRSASRPGNAPAARGWVSTRLPLAELNSWYDDIFSLVQDEELKPQYHLDGRGAGRAATFYFQAGTHGLLLTVNGLWSGALSPFGALLESPKEEVPARLLRLFQDARRLELAPAAEWRPKQIEARVERLSADPLGAPPWPANWPKPVIDPARSRWAAVRLEAAEFETAREVGDTTVGSRVLALDGGSVRVWFRPVLPGEESWHRHVASAAEAARATHAAETREHLGSEREQVRSVLQERIGTPASSPPAVLRPEPVTATLELPPLDRAEPVISPLPRTPDPPNPKSKKSQ